jgi:protein ImuA
MQMANPDTIQALRKEILRLGGIKSPKKDLYQKDALLCMKDHFPNSTFPTAAVHEFMCSDRETVAASIGFIAALNYTLFSEEAVIAWIARDTRIFPPALTAFNLKPHHLIGISPGSIKEVNWVIEEALKCKGLNAVIADIKGFDFTQSRRFQLAVEESGVTGFLMNSTQGAAGNNACVSRWRINSLPSQDVDGLPGVGSPSWNVVLEKIRNGKKGNWQLSWKDGLLHSMDTTVRALSDQPKKWAV